MAGVMEERQGSVSPECVVLGLARRSNRSRARRAPL